MSEIKVIYQSDLTISLKLAAKMEKERMAILLNESFDETPQRFVNNLTKNTYVRPHKHTLPDQWELMSWLAGEIEALAFTEEGILYERYILSADEVKIIEFKPGLIHSFLTHSSGSYLEVRNCAYNPKIDREYAAWAPTEGSVDAAAFLEILKALKFGENVKDYYSCPIKVNS